MRLKYVFSVFVIFLGIFLYFIVNQKDEIRSENPEEIVAPDTKIIIPETLPKMDNELENGIHITGVVVVYNGKAYALTKNEYDLLEKGVDPQVVLSKRE
mgnify:CR=1 FL=1